MKRFLSAALALAMTATVLAGCGTTNNNQGDAVQTGGDATTLSDSNTALKAPKYVFLFIGDGMSYPQIQSTSTSWAR